MQLPVRVCLHEEVCACSQAVVEQGIGPKRDAGQITGTNADLRRLSMVESRKILLKWGVKDEEIQGMQAPEPL